MSEYLRVSERLQKLFAMANCDQLVDEADQVVSIDNCDAFDVVGEYLSGINKGIDLAAKLAAVRSLPGNEDAAIYKLTFDEYADDDGIMLFIGTEEGLTHVFNRYIDPD